MILVTRFDGSTFYINAEMIRSIEHTPDTVITLDSDYKIVVRESIDEIVDRFLEYQRKIHGSELMEYLTKNLKEE